MYKLVSNETYDHYMGATCQNVLRTRLCGYKVDYVYGLDGKKKQVPSYDLLKYDDCQITLLENHACNDNNNFLARDRYWVENTQCVDKHTPSRSSKEYRLDNRRKNLRTSKRIS